MCRDLRKYGSIVEHLSSELVRRSDFCSGQQSPGQRAPFPRRSYPWADGEIDQSYIDPLLNISGGSGFSNQKSQQGYYRVPSSLETCCFWPSALSYRSDASVMSNCLLVDQYFLCIMGLLLCFYNRYSLTFSNQKFYNYILSYVHLTSRLLSFLQCCIPLV